MTITGRRGRRLLLAGPALAAALGLSACGSFDSKASGEHLLQSWVPGTLAKVVGDPLQLKSVDCPSNVKEQNGATYDCKISILDKKTQKTHSGTVTIHMVGKKVEVRGSDLHVN